MERVLEQAMKVAAAAEVFAITSEETEVVFEANRLKQLLTSQQTSVALRIVREGRVGYATATGLEDAGALVSDAVETARFGMSAGFELPGALDYPATDIYDSAVMSVSAGTMTGLGEEMIRAVTDHTPGIVGEASVSRGSVSVKIINSRGGQAAYRRSSFSLALGGQLTRDTDMLFVGESASSCRPLTDSVAVTEPVLRQLEMARSNAAVASGNLPVIFTPQGTASALMLPLMAAFNGKTALEGASPLSHRRGQTVFDRKLFLDDDPTLAYRPASRPCDDEGVPSQRTPLVSTGAVAGFLYDLQTAALAGTRSTASGRRRGGSPPSPAPSAFIISPGETPLAEMLRDIREGLVIEQLMGADQGNILGGDFSGNVLLGYKIENGEMVGRVKDTMVSGNIYRALQEIAAVSRESRWVGGFLSSPYLYLPALTVASKT